MSFATAFADKKLADRNLLSIQQYYEADTSATDKLARVYNFIHGHYTKNQDENSAASLAEAFNNAGVFDFQAFLSDFHEENANIETIISYVTPMNDIQAVSTEINFYYSKDTGNLSYKISEWKIIFTPEFDKFKYDGQILDLFNPLQEDSN